jgi:hypothetical protein
MNITEYKNHVKKIIDSLCIENPSPEEFGAHYTSAETPKLLLKNNAAGNIMRLYDGDYMNDPEEGRYVVDVMIAAAEECTHKHKAKFVERLSKLRKTRLLFSAYQQATFLSSWTITKIKPGMEESADSLNHWRFYGRDGKGSCIIVPMTELVNKFPKQIYRVAYGTEMRGGGSSASQKPINQFKLGLVQRFSAMRGAQKNALIDLEQAIQATHPLLFLFKSSDYSTEEEARIIIHKPSYAAADGVRFDDREPRQAYVEGGQGIICDGSIVFYGPKSDYKNSIDLMGMSEDAGKKIKVYVSTKPYR